MNVRSVAPVLADGEGTVRRPTLGVSLAFVALAIAVFVSSGGRIDPTGAPFPPLLLWLLPVGSVVALLWGFIASHVAFAVCLAVLVAYAVTHPAASVQAATGRFSLLLSFITLQIFVWGYQSTFASARRLLREQQRVIGLRLDEHARLVRTLVDDVQACLAAMAPHLAGEGVTSLAALRAKQHALIELLKQAQHSLVPAERTALSRPNFAFRERVLRLILVLTALQLCIMLLRLAFGIPGPVVPGSLLLVLVLVLLVLLSLRPAWRRWIALVFTLSSQATIVAASAFWGYDGPPPGLVYLVTIAYHAELIALPFSSVAVACLNIGVVSIAVANGAATTLGAALYMLGIVACALAMQAYWALLDRRVASSLQAAEARWDELARSEAFRTRICGTLFHDVANIVQGMGFLVELDDANADDAQALRRLHARLAKLVKAAAETMADENPLLPERLAPVALGGVFGEVAELFAFRLREKQLTLECDLAEPLMVAAQPDLLRDSVLANLVSNAIKFSPRGSAIHLQATRRAGGVEISVRDHGPGIPAELSERLARGARVQSTPGSAGERGLGLGLSLTREHLLRMGGNLALRTHPEGGSEAIVHLRGI